MKKVNLCLFLCLISIAINGQTYDTRAITSESDTVLASCHNLYTSATYGMRLESDAMGGNIGHAWIMDAYLIRTREVQRYQTTGEYMYTWYDRQYYLHCKWGLESSHNGFFLNGFFYPYEPSAMNHNGVVLNTNPQSGYSDRMQIIYNVRK